MKRPRVGLKAPLHVTLKLQDRLPSIRHKNLLREFKESVKKAKSLGLYIIHFSIQSNHIHLFCESENNNALALGMRSLAGRFAKITRKYFKANGLEKRGSVFKGRYHIHVLKTPREVRNALEYVLLNFSKHQKLIEYIDDFSSGRAFKEWRKLLGGRFRSLIKFNSEFWEDRERDFETFLSPPRSWLARVGWMRG